MFSTSAPPRFERKISPSWLMNCFSFCKACWPFESTITTVRYAATFLHGPLCPSLSTDSSTRMVLPSKWMSSLRNAYLATKLPTHMIPSYVLVLDQMPLTPNGKVDRKGLPDPESLVEDVECV